MGGIKIKIKIYKKVRVSDKMNGVKTAHLARTTNSKKRNFNIFRFILKLPNGILLGQMVEHT